MAVIKPLLLFSSRTKAQTEVQPVNICSGALLGLPMRRSDNDKRTVRFCKRAVLANNVRNIQIFPYKLQQTKQLACASQIINTYGLLEITSSASYFPVINTKVMSLIPRKCMFR